MGREELEECVTNMLMSFKIQSDIMGFEYLRTAIILCYENDELKNNISKKVYPLVAKKHNSSPETVERGIRTAIENSYHCGGLLEINELCGFIVYTNGFKWTNGELISTLAELVRLKESRHNFNDKVEKLREK